MMGDPDPKVVQQIMGELRDTNKEKRRTAVMKLGMVGGDQAIRALIGAVQNDYEDLIVRARAAMMLGNLRDPRAVDPLIRALEAPGYQTPLQAAEALGKIGDRRAIPFLRTLAESGTDKTRSAALAALERLGYKPDDTEPQPDMVLEL